MARCILSSLATTPGTILFELTVMGVDVQAQGWKAKSKTLEEVLESTSKMEPKLIGYDETPIDVTDTNKHIVVNADPYNKSNPEIRPMQETDEICSPCVKPFGQRLQSSAKGKLSQIFENRDCGSDSSGTGSIKIIVFLSILRLC